MSPNTAFQLYTLHGYVHGEAMPLVWALLPNKTRATYVELFQAVREAVVARFGDCGAAARTFLTDFELAAIQAIQEVFVGARVKGCAFHFRQAVYRRVQQEGLAWAYEEENNPLRDWIRQLLSFTALPTFAVPLVWTWMKDPPSVSSCVTDCKARALAEYFERTWLAGTFPSELWSHYDNNGPRTTNVAEGWHNGLNSRFGLANPSLRLFLDWLQRFQFEVQCRCLQLAAGKAPRPRRPAYVRVDNELWNAKAAYSVEYGRIFCDIYPYDVAAGMNYFRMATTRYLAHVSHLVGCN